MTLKIHNDQEITNIDVFLNKTKRYKRLSLVYCLKTGSLEIRSPIGVDIDYIKQFVKKQTDWIVKQITNKGKNTSTISSFADKGYIIYNGDILPFVFIESDTPHVEIKNRSLFVSCNLDDINEIIIEWLCQQLVTKAQKYCTQYARAISVKPKHINIKDVKTRWGSCSTTGVINFNWRIAMAPDFVIQYLCAHEICHLRHMSHCEHFWSLVKSIFPHMNVAELWLKSEGMKLYQFG